MAVGCVILFHRPIPKTKNWNFIFLFLGCFEEFGFKSSGDDCTSG